MPTGKDNNVHECVQAAEQLRSQKLAVFFLNSGAKSTTGHHHLTDDFRYVDDFRQQVVRLRPWKHLSTSLNAFMFDKVRAAETDQISF